MMHIQFVDVMGYFISDLNTNVLVMPVVRVVKPLLLLLFYFFSSVCICMESDNRKLKKVQCCLKFSILVGKSRPSNT